MNLDFFHNSKNDLKSISKKLLKFNDEKIYISAKQIYCQNDLGSLPEIQHLWLNLKKNTHFPPLEIFFQKNTKFQELFLLLDSFWENDQPQAREFAQINKNITELIINEDGFLIYLEVLDTLVKNKELNIFIKNEDGTKRPFIDKAVDSLTEHQHEIIDKIKQNNYQNKNLKKKLQKTDTWAIAAIFKEVDTSSFFKFLLENFNEKQYIEIITSRDRRRQKTKSIIDSTYKRQLIYDYTLHIAKGNLSEEINLLSHYYIIYEINQITHEIEKLNIQKFFNFFKNNLKKLLKLPFTPNLCTALDHIEKNRQITGVYSLEVIENNQKKLTDQEQELLKIILLYFSDKKDSNIKKLFGKK